VYAAFYRHNSPTPELATCVGAQGEAIATVESALVYPALQNRYAKNILS
jgi:hypothetical protein